MAYNSNNRSERLLQGRRFTTDELTLAQEAFTDVFDLGAGEIFTDDGLIPSGSSQLAFSGSTQDGGIISGSVVNPTLAPNVEVLKYHFRKKLKPAGNGNRQVYYFTTADPSSPTDGVSSDQLIESDQQTNFVSPKYIIAAHSTRNAEASTTGYKAVVFKDTSATAGGISTDAITDDNYVFDYKTGVLTWNSGQAPTTSQYVYMSVYQYVGRTLRSQIDDGTVGTSMINNGLNNRVLTAINSSSMNGEANLTFDGSLLTVTGNATITGNLTVTGDTIENQVSNLNVQDKFILLNSGSSTATDESGIIFGGSEGAANSGSALFWNGDFNSNDGRLAIGSAAASSTTTTANYFIAGVISGSSDIATGSQADHYGNIRIDNGDIFIYV
tara:strand:+ start:2675 stop:3826 length:1152 start_codon:yes stop_codon:yes gene_type:complete